MSTNDAIAAARAAVAAEVDLDFLMSRKPEIEDEVFERLAEPIFNARCEVSARLLEANRELLAARVEACLPLRLAKLGLN